MNSTSLKILACNRVYLNLVSYLINFLRHDTFMWVVLVKLCLELREPSQRFVLMKTLFLFFTIP